MWEDCYLGNGSLGHWVMGHWSLGHWSLGHWVIGHWSLGHWFGGFTGIAVLSGSIEYIIFDLVCLPGLRDIWYFILFEDSKSGSPFGTSRLFREGVRGFFPFRGQGQ